MQKFFFLTFLFALFNVQINKIPEIINSPILPENDKDYAKKKINSSHFNLSNPRYNFQEDYNKRKIFKINYSYNPYIKISKNFSYEQNAMDIYISTGMLNITKLEYFYQPEKCNIDISNLNEIHLSMAFDKNYSDLALISIASILNTSNIDTYIHFHILALNFGYAEIKKIIALRKINTKVEFIFYNAKQVEYDFDKAKYDRRKYGNYAKILIPEIVNNTNKILIIDSGDKFKTNNFHPNAGVFLVNVRLFRKDELYKKAVFVGKSYHYFECPVQEILITITLYKFAYIPLNYNLNLYYENESDSLNRRMIPSIGTWQRIQRFSPHKYSFDELVDAMTDPVVQHFYLEKIQHLKRCNKYVYQWLKYVNLTGKYHQLKKKYKEPFACEKIFGFI